MSGKTCPIIRAEHQHSGIWRFRCFACKPKRDWTEVSAPHDALKKIRNHADEFHCNTQIRLIRKSQYSGEVNKLYRATAKPARSVMSS